MTTSPADSFATLFFRLGCLSAAFAVAVGAFGAHGLKTILSGEMLSIYETAARYQMYHAFALLVTGIAGWHGAKIKLPGWCFIGGTILFSGSLYLLTLTGAAWLGAITPLGGAAFIAGWLLLGFSALQNHSR